jgi:protein-S-isoprenylcysteine O-methyltransferase Ste14
VVKTGARRRNKKLLKGSFFVAGNIKVRYTTSMNKGVKAFFGIVSVSPVLFLVGLMASFILFQSFPVKIVSTQLLANAITAFGAILILLGTTLAFAAQRISRVVTNPKYKATCPDLMQGPYAYSRHPGSLALIVMYIGFTLVVNSLVMVGLAIVFILLLTIVFVPAEEKVISELCPEAYAEYKTKVRMWI